MMKRLFVSVVAAVSLLDASSAHAISTFSIESLANVSQSTINEVIQTVAVGTSHRAYMSAAPMGWDIGLDIGVEVTAVGLPSAFKSDISSIDGGGATVPQLIPLPKLNVHKGLPFGLDVGMSFISYSDDLRLLGLEAKWAFIKGGALSPSGALRLSYTSEKLWYIEGKMWQADVLFSKSLLFLDPYIGAGLQFWSGNFDVPLSLPAGYGLPTSVSGSASGTNVHFFAGTPIKLLGFWVTPEADYSTAGIYSFGTKLSFNF